MTVMLENSMPADEKKTFSPLSQAYHIARSKAGISEEAHKLYKEFNNGLSSKKWDREWVNAQIAEAEAGPTEDDKQAARLFQHSLNCAYEGLATGSLADSLFRQLLLEGDIPIRIWALHLCWLICQSEHIWEAAKGHAHRNELLKSWGKVEKNKRTLKRFKRFKKNFQSAASEENNK